MLSHRWSANETSFMEAERSISHFGTLFQRKDKLGRSEGMKKIQEFCCTANKLGYSWAWADTCCINKTDSSELQESITSMFSWYQNSAITIVHLNDVPDPILGRGSGWFRRGWTLQELLAPTTLRFYSRNWRSLGRADPSGQHWWFNHKADPLWQVAIERVTGIHGEYLSPNGFHPGLEDLHAKLEWAKYRQTTREEDKAYCLMGILGVSMPIMYGEKEKATERLCETVVQLANFRGWLSACAGVSCGSTDAIGNGVAMEGFAGAEHSGGIPIYHFLMGRLPLAPIENSYVAFVLCNPPAERKFGLSGYGARCRGSITAATLLER
ncbi:hypothetical protein CONPUDRAFT_102613 [Coniophora puteana RWD-64-598 SS2]|uniref:Heterokaryon incompatibility domain-containing protein n=1 Tax=Coniophora puteana (strain RWD-64-598) TaxID=741705 RepID=A0A5M3MRU9_CONPW|nr:uncharacterized protein CONPUDRAFT_102613 [Coniophora puteana RWD-64-598 SS2]EIW81879.1 hypothetical protein CONPUDRAFT_102613 [Coniophora puteana RWD-64-598 SS2]